MSTYDSNRIGTHESEQRNAVIVFTHRLNEYWPGAYGEAGQNRASLAAARMARSAYGLKPARQVPARLAPSISTAVPPTATERLAIVCDRLYLMMGDSGLSLVAVPPSSTRDSTSQLAAILAEGIPYTSVKVSLNLERAGAIPGITDYGKVTVAKAGLLTPSVAAKALEMRSQLKARYLETITAPAREGIS